MSLWGNKDSITGSNTVTATVTVTAANATVVGVNTKLSTDFKVGDFLHVGENDYVFTALANDTVATVASATGGALVGAQSNASYIVSEKPKYIKYSQYIDADTVYGVATEELEGNAGVGSVTVSAAGTGFTARPTVSFSGGGGSGATATATAKVVTFTVGSALDADAGTGYANGDVSKVEGGTGTAAKATVTTGASNTSVASLALVNGGSYTVLPSLTGEATIAETGSGSGLLVDLAMGLNDVTVTASGNNYSSAPTVTIGGAGGVGATATATLQSTEAASVTHAGWVVRTEGSGGRAGRVQYETLVAMSSIQGDAEDDAQLPE